MDRVLISGIILELARKNEENQETPQSEQSILRSIFMLTTFRVRFGALPT